MARAAVNQPGPRRSAIASKHVVVVGAGIGGLATAIDLAAAGLRVTVLERASAPGGKMREVAVGRATIDAGPTLLTMRWAFDELFARAGTTLDRHLVLHRATTIARHAWAGDHRLDLHADLQRSVDAVGTFAGARDAAGYRTLCQQAQRMYETLESRFIKAPRTQGMDVALAAGPFGLARLKPFTTLADMLAAHVKDPRLLQLLGRTSTNYGTSPYQAPAAMLLLAHVERAGLFWVEGGMQRLAEALVTVAEGLGVTVRLDTPVKEITSNAEGATGARLDSGETIRADAVVMNGETSALASGMLGRGVTRAAPVLKFPQRSLSATNWAVVAEATGTSLLRRTICFSRDTKLEFELINSGRLPTEPTIEIIAQDRSDSGPAPDGPERLLLSVNAPASGDRRAFSQVEIDQCMQGMTALMQRCGLELRLTEAPVMTSPATFHRLFPASGGALHGQAFTGLASAFQRPGSRSKVKSLYLAGGGTHPGPGLPFAVLSGRQAAAAILADLAPPRSAMARLFRRA